jgi:AraC-like DNA-binding protein
MYAKQLIESGETASGAAYKVGFGDYSAFYRAYVKILGAPPTSEAKRKFTESLTEEVLDE